MKPDFICIGAQKAGTSWLHANCEKHPDFAMPPVKELHYFDREEKYLSADHLAVTRLKDRMADPVWKKKMIGDIWRPLRSLKISKARWWARFHLNDFTDDWYRSLFDIRRGLSGDVTPSYSAMYEEDIAHMHRVAPQAKLIFLIRNPVDRVWSMLRFAEQHGRPLDLEDLDKFKRRVDAPAQDMRTDYLRTVDLVLKYYAPEQLMIGFFDAIRRDPDGLFGAVCDYLGASRPSGGGGGLRKKVNESKKKSSCPPHFRDYLVSKYAGLTEALADRYGSYATEWLKGLRGDEVVSQDADSFPAVIFPGR